MGVPCDEVDVVGEWNASTAIRVHRSMETHPKPPDGFGVRSFSQTSWSSSSNFSERSASCNDTSIATTYARFRKSPTRQCLQS